MRTFSFVFMIMVSALFAQAAVAGPWDRMDQNIKLPSQSVLDHDNWLIPLGASASRVKIGAAISSSAATTISSFTNQPDYPRNIVLTPTGTTSNVGAGTAVVNGTNIYGKSISENFTIASTQSTATTGAKAFKSISSIVFPQASGAGVTLSIGIGAKLGLLHCLDDAGKYVFSEFNSAYETTRGTAVADASHVESNTFAPNGSMDGAKPVDAFYIQNFRCYGN